eukprot:152085_1
MSLRKAIKFRHLISQLTHEESVGFLSKMMNSHMDIVVTFLFRHFAKTNQTNPVDSFNDSLSDIIQSRKEKPKAVSLRNPKLSQLPIAITGHIASFLTQQTYFQFSASSRSIYLGCNSPNLLHELNLIDVDDSSCINLELFPSVKSLSIDSLQAITLPRNANTDSPIVNQLTTLTLDASESDENDGWVQQFLDRNIVNCNTVKTLKCLNFADRQEMEGKTFLDLLNSFPNLKHLKLHHITTDVTAEDILNVCPNLDGLTVNSGDSQLNANLITLFASKLKCLSFVQYHANEFDFDSVNFATLEELHAVTPDYQSLNCILKSASNMKKVLIRPESKGELDGLMSNVEMKSAMQNIIVECRFLEYLYVQAKSSHFCSVLDGIECGLFKTKKLNRTELKIHICLEEMDSELKANTLALNAGRIVNSLESSAINDFMFIWELSDDDVDDDLLKETFSELCNISVHTKVLRHQDVFTITNQQCKINGFDDLICGK